ncbi:hypothetical protein CS0771_22680 [Catellatospora sp. IY07-71]|uniref:hypothetical protein n=1 Tax=Catellatospora sp. IY07-71 TaxID=2728827 RepID=UPI001BB3CF2E|nr:hypothetical protein [Catellatospora sp. IY07-71]BCJ72724.1 hypothetical protein CS0771_22680 [Catellatospora sp. IY07-71]
MITNWLTWFSLPKQTRAAARAAGARAPHPDPAVQEAIQVRARLYGAAVLLVGLAAYVVGMPSLFTDDLPEIASSVGFVVLFVTSSELRTLRTAAWTAAVVQWPAMAARAAGPPERVRLRPAQPWDIGSVLGLTFLPVGVLAAVHDPDGLPHVVSDPSRLGGWLAWSFSAVWLLVVAVAGLATLVWFLIGLRDVWRSLRRVACLEVGRDGVRLPLRNLRVSWADVAEVTAGPEEDPAAFGLRLCDPPQARRGERLPLWRRLTGSHPDPPELLLIRMSEARGDLFPAYRAALAFHAESVAGPAKAATA